MLILGIDTATSMASVALMRDGHLLAERALSCSRAHTETLLPMVTSVLDDTDYTPGDLSAIAVDHGPGSFTGIRIGVCSANAMGMALGVPVMGISSLEAMQEPFSVLDIPVCAMINARNENSYAAVYRKAVCMKAPEAVHIDACLQALPPNTLIIGDGAQAYRERILAVRPEVILAPAHFHMPRASAVCKLAWQQIIACGPAEKSLQASPCYLRLSQAERLSQKSETAPMRPERTESV